jgi:hypothetical protein
MGTNLADGYGFDQSIDEILDGIIDRRRRLSRLIELKSKVMVNAEEHEEIPFLEQPVQAIRLQFGETRSARQNKFERKLESHKPPAHPITFHPTQ